MKKKLTIRAICHLKRKKSIVEKYKNQEYQGKCQFPMQKKKNRDKNHLLRDH